MRKQPGREAAEQSCQALSLWGGSNGPADARRAAWAAEAAPHPRQRRLVFGCRRGAS